MIDRTPLHLRATYEKWFDDHPGSRAEIPTTTVRQQTVRGVATGYVKNTPGGDVAITRQEFDARYWAREQLPKSA